MTRSSDNRWLHRFAVFTAVATFCLIWVGGLVTSHGAGMAVPDWPTTYGYNMFFFPFSKWVGGIFYEHSHRLVASGVGLLTVILSVWLWVKEERRWLRWLGVIALVAVVFQGVLGGLRVVQMKDVLGVFHATLAQLFFGLVSAIALFTSSWWSRAEPMAELRRSAPVPGRSDVRALKTVGISEAFLGGHVSAPEDGRTPATAVMGSADQRKMSIYAASGLRYSFATVTGLILLQLILGAAMRHQHAGLAIPDFPAAYGKLWPAMDAESVARYNQARGEVTATNLITSFQIGLQMTHRIGAFLILIAVAWVAGAARRRAGGQSVLAKFSAAWLALILVQAALGAATIWTNKAADLATLHVAVGALSLVNGVMLALMAARLANDQTATLSLGRAAMKVPERPASATA